MFSGKPTSPKSEKGKNKNSISLISGCHLLIKNFIIFEDTLAQPYAATLSALTLSVPLMTSTCDWTGSSWPARPTRCWATPFWGPLTTSLGRLDSKMAFPPETLSFSRRPTPTTTMLSKPTGTQIFYFSMKRKENNVELGNFSVRSQPRSQCCWAGRCISSSADPTANWDHGSGINRRRSPCRSPWRKWCGVARWRLWWCAVSWTVMAASRSKSTESPSTFNPARLAAPASCFLNRGTRLLSASQV